jgi:hypothetical protein
MLNSGAVFTKPEFSRFARELASKTGHQGRAYLRYHETRLWRTYLLCARYLDSGKSFASVGAGSAYVEAALVQSLGARGTVLDLPDVVASERHRYLSLGLEAFGLDLSGQASLAEAIGLDFDLVLSAEIVEHLPIPPSRHFGMLSPLIRSGGVLVVGTPNAGSIRRVLKTLLHIPVLPPAELTFGPVDFEHESVHRREYMPVEIKMGLQAAGLVPEHVEYLSYAFSSAADVAFALPELVVPYFRNGVNVVGRKHVALTDAVRTTGERADPQRLAAADGLDRTSAKCRLSLGWTSAAFVTW